MGTTFVKPVDHREKALKSLGELPPFSPILNKLLATLASDDISFGAVAELIEKDTVLAGNVLRLVNSALYGRRGTISSVRHAVSLMGLVKLRNTVMTLSVSRIWTQTRTPRGWSAARFNLHAVATAVMADLLALKVPAVYPEGAFVAGLLHDVGLLMLGIGCPEEFQEVRRLHVNEGQELAAAEHSVVGFDHGELSAAALRKWNLPEPIQNAARHQFNPDPNNGAEYSLSKILNVADRLIDRRDITLFEHVPGDESNPVPLLAELGLDDRQIEVSDEFEREFEPMKAFF